MRAILCLLLLATPLSSCSFVSPSKPVLGYEHGDQNCSDKLDNDHDGLFDCEDPDCILKSALCGEIIPNRPFIEPEGVNALPPGDPGDAIKIAISTCHDFIDNDGNGQFDCGDPACAAIEENCCIREFTDEACSDGIDNDQNGFADCEDFACRNGPFVTVDCSRQTQSTSSDDEGEDNVTDPGEENTTERCTDGQDNDGDGFADCADFDCPVDTNQVIFAYCEANKENTVETCSDGIDQDSNGFTDCSDFSCSRLEDDGSNQDTVDFCKNAGENTAAKCSDGLDNDKNGFLDCDDHSCSRLEDDKSNQEAYDYCQDLLETTVEECSDRIDNDGNGFADCQDHSCSRSENPDVLQVCQESFVSNTEALNGINANTKCSDGIDNDKDGFVDCDDWECSYNPAVTICPETKICD